jgi:uncharacterized repeat protein (TIGR01451 family)
MRLPKVLFMSVAVMVGTFLPARASGAPAATADLSVTISDHPDPVVYRWDITYTVKVKNHGLGMATGVVLVDTYGSDMGYVSAGTTQARARTPPAGSSTARWGASPMARPLPRPSS